MKFLFALFLSLMVSAAALACPCTGDDSPCVCPDGCACSTEFPAGVKLAEERIVNLPQDHGKWYVSVIGDPQDARYREITNWFRTNSDLKLLKDRNHFNAINTDSKMYVERYKKTVPATPCVRIQAPDGQVFYQVSGNSIPFSAEALSQSISQGVVTNWGTKNRNCGPFRCRPRPQPEPAPAPDGDPDPQPIDDVNVQPDVLTNRSDWPSPLALGLSIFAGLLIGGGAGVAAQYRKEHPAAE